jgi:predicted ATPase/signal transduction histidine kinase/PAS domain-containing protein
MFEQRTLLSTGERFEVSRASSGADRGSVVLKTVRSDRRAPRSEELLRHEWNVLRGLDIAGVARPLRLEHGGSGPILVLEDAGPQNLRDLLDGRPLDTPRFLDLAISMAETIGEVHRRGLIHRDICPMNFVVGDHPTLVDFESATATPAFTQAPDPPGELQGTLAYIAPEQTGRMNRGVDRRADLYALGATFYEMLTGAPPFSAREPLELLHAHVARRPHTPAVVNAGVPTVLSNIVVKLLSKMPEWRYQSAEALKVDLDEARTRWRSSGTIDGFELGLHDAPYGLLISGHLYGREQPQAELEGALERVATGRAEAVLVEGPAGIGKSALVHQVRDLARVPCRWLEGKGDPLRENVPYAAVLDAMRGFVRETLHEPADRVAMLRDRLRSALSPNGRVLTESVPELQQLMGELPPVLAVGPLEAENRFHAVFIALVRALVKQGTVLVLFLEDLQWVDPASLKLLTAIAIEPGLRGVLVIGTCRTGEVSTDGTLARAATRMREWGTPLATLDLGPLDKGSIVALLCEALRLDPEEVAPLAETIAKKTAGNPLSVRRFLAHLYEAGLLVYDPRTGRWSWDIVRVKAAEVTENVVDLLAMSIAMLSAREQDVLTTAACVGSVFGLGQLASIRGETLDDTARALWRPVREGLIVPVDSGPRFRWAGEQPIELGAANAPAYRFVHDRVHEATLRSLGDAAQRDLNLRIGRWLLANVPEDGLDDAVCSIADHLDRAADRLTQGERVRVAQLNHRAGRVARALAAPASALRYFSLGIQLLPSEPWATDVHELWFALVRDAAESAALAGDHAACERLAEHALPRTDIALEKAELGRVLAHSSAIQGAHGDAIRRGRDALRVLGVELPPPLEVSEAAASAERERTREVLHDRSDRQLLERGAMQDAEERARLRLYVALASATWFTAPELFRIVSSRAVDLTVRRGVGEESPFAFAAYAIALVMDGEYEEADRFGRLAVAFARRASNPAQECRALMVLGGHVSPWRAPLRDSVPVLREAYARGIESGELEYAAYASANLLFALWFRGATLDSVLAETDAALSFYRRIGHLGGVAYVTPFVPAARCLKGLTRGHACFEDREFDEPSFLREAAANGLAQAVYHVLRLQTCYLLGDPATALSYARSGERWLPHLRTIFLQADHCFYAALALSSLHDTASREERYALLSQIRGHRDRLETWARHSPATFGHKRDLLAAEIARLELRTDAFDLYERAIASARREGCVHEEALAHERCARLLAARGDRDAAETHFRRAGEGFAAWGALAKVKLLSQEHPPTADVARSPTLGSFTGRPIETVDFQFLLRASETLTSELVLDRLLQKLMPLCIEAASAERAVLVLDEDGLVVRAVARVDDVTLQRTSLAQSTSAPSSIVEQVLRTGAEVVVRDALSDARFANDPYVASVGVRSVLAVPLRKGDRAVGILYFENNLATDAFTPERVEVFRLLSAQMGIALENSLLFEERRRVEAGLTLLANASAALSESLEYEQVLATLGGLVVPELADWCVVDAVDGRRLVPAAARHVDPSKQHLVEGLQRGTVGDVDSPRPQAQALRARRSLLVSDVTRDFLRAGARDEEHLRLIEALEPRSLLIVPLVAHGRGIGVLTLVRSTNERRLGESDLSVAEGLARRAALALDNARLHRDQRERNRHLRMIFRQAPGAIWATDLDLKFTHVAGNVLNAPELDVTLLGKSVHDLVGAGDPTDPAIARHLAALAGGPQSFQYRFRDRWYEVSIEPLRDQDRRIVGSVGAAFDVTERRATAERLAEAQRVAHVGSFEWHVVRNVMTWSDELHRIYGLEPGRFAGTYDAFIEQIHPDDLEHTKTVVFEACRDVKPFEYDHRIVRPDASVRTLHTRGDVVADEVGKPVRVVGSCWDVTELKESVRALEHAVSRWEATLDATAEGILVVDLEGHVSAVNQRFVNLWRIPAHAAPRRDHLRLLQPVLEHLEDAPSFLRRIREIYEQPELESFDVVRFTDGRLFERQSIPQRIGEEIVGRVWSIRDVTERERLFRRALFLADATRLLASLDVEPALDSVAHIAVPYLGDGCAIDLLGDGGPRRLLAVSRDATQPIHSDLHHSALAGHSTIYPVGQRSYMAVPLLVKGALVGAITFAASGSRRYTPEDLELAEELARRAALSVENARLYRGARDALQARDEFLSIAAHEIRGPVTSMHLAVQGILTGKIPPSAMPRALDVIQREDRRLARFVDELLDIGRIRGGRMQFTYEEVDLSDVVRSATAKAAAELARSGSSLSVTTEGQCVGHWDRFRLDQVVTNLLSNAIKFGLGKPIAISVKLHDGRVSLVVKDHGIGISPEMHKRIFRPFERAVAVRHYGGLGLGLFIVHTVVDGLGGRITVESTPNTGATFTVELPRGGRR